MRTEVGMVTLLSEDSALPSDPIRHVKEIIDLCVNCLVWRVGLPLNVSVRKRQRKTFGPKVVVAGRRADRPYGGMVG